MECSDRVVSGGFLKVSRDSDYHNEAYRPTYQKQVRERAVAYKETVKKNPMILAVNQRH
jgi:hypothetical protein